MVPVDRRLANAERHHVRASVKLQFTWILGVQYVATAARTSIRRLDRDIGKANYIDNSIVRSKFDIAGCDR